MRNNSKSSRQTCTCEGSNRLDQTKHQSLKRQARGMSHDLLALARRVAREHPGEYAHLVIAADVLCRICTADLTLECPRCAGNPYAGGMDYGITQDRDRQKSSPSRPVPPRLPQTERKTELSPRKTSPAPHVDGKNDR